MITPHASLSAVLRAAADRWPQTPAVVAPAATLTYRALDRAADSAATALLAAGARVGTRIAAALGHDLAAFVLPFACARANVAALLLNPTLAAPRWAEQLRAARPSLLVADGAHAERLHAVGDGRAVVSAERALALDTQPGDLPRPAPPDQPVALITTSGTTGAPKMAMVTGRGVVAAARGYVSLLGLRSGERTLVVLPLHYIGPLSAQTTTMALVGGTAVLPADTRPHAAASALAAHRITLLDAVPSWLGVFARLRDLPHLPHWRTLIYGGAPMPADTAATLARRFPHVALYDVWGLSEAHGPVTARRYDRERPPAPGDVGHPLPGVSVQARVDGRVCAPGQPGELHVAGENVTPGYADDPAATAAVLRDGWLATGDAGTIAADGSVRVLDRLKDVILRGGSNVFSAQVEQVLCTAPGVVEAAVYGIPDRLGGEAVAAAVVLAEGVALDVAGLRRLVADEVGVYAVPRLLYAVDALPRNPTGKIDKRVLRTSVHPHTRGVGF